MLTKKLIRLLLGLQGRTLLRPALSGTDMRSEWRDYNMQHGTKSSTAIFSSTYKQIQDLFGIIEYSYGPKPIILIDPTYAKKLI